MNRNQRIVFTFAVVVAWCIAPRAGAQVPMGTAFNDQSQLNQNASPVSTTCDFEFSLFNDPDLFALANQGGSARIFDGMGENLAPISVTPAGSGRPGLEFFTSPRIPDRRSRSNNRVLGELRPFFRDSGFAPGGFWCVT